VLSPDTYFIDVNIIYQIFVKNIWYLSRLLIVAYAIFYWLPIKIFPQEFTGKGVQKIVFNFTYMVAYVEVVVTFLVFIKAFSLLLFIFALILTKLAFLKWYYKKNIVEYLNNLRTSMMLMTLDMLDMPKENLKNFKKYVKSKVVHFLESITLYKILKNILFFAVFFYIVSTLMARGMQSYADPTPDTSQFIEWVTHLQQNQLFWDTKAFGADFYGQAVIIFFVNIFTNLDVIILFSLYPVLLLLALYFSIYYVVKSFTSSQYIALFAVMFHGLILMSPLGNYFLGKVVETSLPEIVDFYGLKFYMPTLADTISQGHNIAYITYIRYISGLAYEHASVFVLLNAYFLIKTIQTHLNKYLIIYGLTLMLVFTFHGGGAIVLIVVSILIALNGFLFRKIDFVFLKKGVFVILLASIVGNLWILSMIKYGIPQNFGAAAPMLDKIFHTKNNLEALQISGAETLRIIAITHVHMFLWAITFFAYILAFTRKNRFVNTSMILIVIGIFITYFGPNVGTPLFAKQSRLAEYFFFALTLLSIFYFFLFFYKPIYLIFKKYARIIVLLAIYFIFTLFTLATPSWMNSKKFLSNINNTEYTSIPDTVLKIYKENRPFSWTIVSYIQEYAKVRNKGYHINTQNFLLRYNPQDKFLKVPTPKIYLFVENSPNPYRGMDEWYYRWRGKIQRNFKSWVAIYGMTHNNIKIYKKTKNITVYEINNKNYIKFLRKKENK
jgi:hypothetical protein